MPPAITSQTTCRSVCSNRNIAKKVGTLVSTGLLAPNLYLETGAYRVKEAWDQLSDVTALRRKKEPLQWAGFDHIVRLSREYLDRRGGVPQP